MTDFFKTFISNHQEEVQSFQKKLNNPKNNTLIHPSILLTNLIGIYTYFQDYIVNKLLVEFSSEQSNIYDENLKKLKEISTNYKEYKELLDYSKNNYYKLSYSAKSKDLHLKNNPIFKGENNKDDSLDLFYFLI